MTDNIQPIRAMTDDDALGWLQAQGSTDLPQVELAKRWGWRAQRVHKRLRSWERGGIMRREGKAIIVANAERKSQKSPWKSPYA